MTLGYEKADRGWELTYDGIFGPECESTVYATEREARDACAGVWMAAEGMVVTLDGKNAEGIRSPADLFREVNAASPEAGMRLKQQIARFQPKLILNQVRTQTDVEVGFSVKSVSKRYFGIDIDYVGYLDYDTTVWQAVRRKRPFVVEFPNSRLVGSIDRITHYLFKKGGSVRPIEF